MLLAALAVTPVLLERGGVAALHEAASRCANGTDGCGGFQGLEVEWLGVRIVDGFAVRSGIRIDAETLGAQLGWQGLHVEVSGVRLTRIGERSSLPVVRATPSLPDPPSRATTEALPGPPRITALHGVPLSIRVRGPVVLPIDAARIRVHDALVTIDASGQPSARFGVDVRRGQLWAASSRALVVRPTNGFQRFHLDGIGRIGEGLETTLSGWVEREHAVLVLESQADGRLTLQASAGPSPRLTALADRFPLRTFTSIAAIAGLDPADARISGQLELAWRDRLHAHLGPVRIDDASLEHRLLANGRIAFDPVTMTGDVWLRDRTDAEAELDVNHGELRTHVSARWHHDRLTLAARLAPLSCQSLVDGLPPAVTGLARGMTLTGEIAGQLSLSLEPGTLTGVARTSEPPGQIALAFPFLEACTIVEDPPRIDLAALVGPYPHRFVDGLGRTRERTLAAGDPGFVSLASVPLLAAAFVTLEDDGFWRHDGFELEQIERALWHNLERGRIVRGASTVTQQTVRNLFLGLDRTLARKLQEALLTMRLEAVVPKARILEIYLNIIELAPGVHGVEDAAQFYFGKSARELDVLEAVHLAALAPAPHLYARRFASGHVDAPWMAELRTQVRRMAMRHLIDAEQTRRALHARLDLRVRP